MTLTKILLLVLTAIATTATGAIALDVFPHGSVWVKVCALASWVLNAFGIVAANNLPSPSQAKRIDELEKSQTPKPDDIIAKAA
jgi:hypothetical protein